MSSSDSPVDLLTPDLLLVVFSWLELRDLVSCCRVKAVHTCAMDQSLYQALAVRRFGERLTESTLSLYQGDYRAMMAHDNQKGAQPTLLHLPPSHWNQNDPDRRFYCCRIPSIEWYRDENLVIVCLDVLGENDLRDPYQSSIVCRPHRAVQVPTSQASSSSTAPPLRQRRRGGERMVYRAPHLVLLFHEYEETASRGRKVFQGGLHFSANVFRTPGTYSFCFSNRHRGSILSDFEEIPILTIAEGERGLSMAAFERAGGESRKLYFTGSGDVPSDETEKITWAPPTFEYEESELTRRRLRES